MTTATDGKEYRTSYYNLDVIISVGYRVKSQRGVEFRKWASGVLKDYIIKGRAENDALYEMAGSKRMADETLVAITIMIAESKPEEKETMVSLVMNFLV